MVNEWWLLYPKIHMNIEYTKYVNVSAYLDSRSYAGWLTFCWLTCKTKKLKHLQFFYTHKLFDDIFLSLWNLSFYSLHRRSFFPFPRTQRCGINIEVVYVVANYFLSLTNAFEMQGNSVDDDDVHDVAFAPFQKENISFACAKWGEKS